MNWIDFNEKQNGFHWFWKDYNNFAMFIWFWMDLIDFANTFYDFVSFFFKAFCLILDEEKEVGREFDKKWSHSIRIVSSVMTHTVGGLVGGGREGG